ncbi:B12-binding domain-containing protein [Streptomyces sp. NPDC048566]|uniref:cobalamin B12-binding domain-containing protein n=1 Tax=Streptomyces sp. NPDC048566 TaxID=3365569 RepID=UPI00371A899B
MTASSTRSAAHLALPEARERLWQAVHTGDEPLATTVVLDTMTASGDPESVLLDLIAPVQARVGLEWAANRLTVAQEHTATAIHERAIAVLAHHTRPGPDTVPRGSRVTVACVDGEWHALPARLLAETLRLRGWQVDFLGAHVPTPHLIGHLHRTGPDAVALSSSIPTHLPAAHTAITACQAAGVPVIAGGAAFGPDGRHARALGADAWAGDARQAAAALAKGLDRPDPMAAHQTVDDLPHLVDQEYTIVARTTHQLVKETLTELENRFPPMRRYAEEQRRRTAEDLAHIVEFLGTSLYVDDEELFAGFILWTAGILTARRVPARSLDPALDLLAVQLKDFPRACRTLAHAREALRTRSTPAFTIPGPGKPA